MVKIVVDPKCTGCETCVNTCPVGVYEIKDGKSNRPKSANVWSAELVKHNALRVQFR